MSSIFGKHHLCLGYFIFGWHYSAVRKHKIYYSLIIRSNRGSVNQEHIGDFGIPHADPPLFNKSLIKIKGAESLQTFLRRKGYFDVLSSALSRLEQKADDLESNVVAEGVKTFCVRILSSTSRCKSN